MGLIRTILALVILLILVHVGLVYTNIGQGANILTNAVYSLGHWWSLPPLLLNTVTPLQRYLNPDSFYVVAFTAAAVYFILYLLLGVGRRISTRWRRLSQLVCTFALLTRRHEDCYQGCRFNARRRVPEMLAG